MADNRCTKFIHTALDNHVLRFEDENKNFSSQTVTEGLEKIHSSNAQAKGTMISGFNATHSSNNIICPAMSGNFTPDKEKGYAKFLHLGTTRIWNADGSINEERWQKFFINTVTEENGSQVVTWSNLTKYLQYCYDNDPQENNTGRNTNAFFSSKPMQGFAASSAWQEVFDRLACGWTLKDNGEYESFMSLEKIREFFENSELAFQEAETQALPIPKPGQSMS